MARTGRPITPLVLSDEERAQLTRWERRRKSSQALALRSRIVLGCAEGLANKHVAEACGVTPATVGKWRRQLRASCDSMGWCDEPRPGQAADDQYLKQVEDVVVTTLKSTPKNATHWSRARWPSAPGSSKSSVGRIWRTFELQPHLTDGFKLTTDPLFAEKVYDVFGLYLDPPETAVVLCVDELCEASHNSSDVKCSVM